MTERPTTPTRIMLCAAIVITLTAGCRAEPASPSAAGPPIPFEDVGACPFEGCTYREWRANAPVEVRAGRTRTAPIAFSVNAGERVTALGGVVVTTRPGRVEFDEPQEVPVPGGSIRIGPGQELYLLTYEGEGFSKAWFGGRVYGGVDISGFAGGGCTGVSPCRGRIVEQWQRDWWVQVRNAARMVGWTSEPEKFDNKDALG